MRITAVPAQITTVEDRIFGKLGFSQMMLVVVPIFMSGGAFALLPPMMESAVYKYVVMGSLILVCSFLAIRIRGKIIALWLAMILRYNLRPKYYLYDKNSLAHRQMYTAKHMEQEAVVDKKQEKPAAPRLDIPTTAKVRATLDNPAANVRFETGKKGGLRVRFKKVEK